MKRIKLSDYLAPGKDQVRSQADLARRTGLSKAMIVKAAGWEREGRDVRVVIEGGLAVELQVNDGWRTIKPMPQRGRA